MSAARPPVHERWILLVLALAYALFVVHAYIWKVTPVFAYLGCELVDRPAWLVALSIGWAVLPVAFLPIRSERASSFFLWILYVIVFVPSVTIPGLSMHLQAWDISTLQLLLTIGFAILSAISSMPPRRVAETPMGERGWTYLIVGLVLLSLAILIPMLGLASKVRSYADIYMVRNELKDELESSSVVARYLVPWMAYAVVPLVTLQSLIQRRRLALAGALFYQAYLFLQTGHKSYLLPFIVLPASLWGFRKIKGRMPMFILIGMVGLFVSGYLIDAWTGTPLATSLIIRRAVITPGQLTGMYFDFFSHHPQIWFSNNLLKPVLDYPYSAPVPFIIGDHYFNAPDMSANANIWADAFATMGSLGILLFSALLGWILWLYDGIVRTKWPDWVGAILFIVPALSLTNSALLTCLLTHGVGPFILLAWLMPKACMERRPAAKIRNATDGRGRDGERAEA